MRILIPLAIIALSVSGRAQSAPRIYVSVEEANTVVVVDSSTFRINAKVPVGSHPHNLTALGQGLVVVANWGSTFVSVLDPADRQRARSIGVHVRPHDVAAASDDTRVYVASEDRAVVFVDLAAGRVLQSVRIGRSPQHMAFSDDGREIWITETETSRAYVIDVEPRRLKATIDLGGPPHHVALDARRAYIAVGPAHLVIVDLKTHAIVRRLEVGPHPHDVVVSR